MKEQLLKQIEELKRQVELLDKPKFEVGKWYKDPLNNYMVFVTQNTGKLKSDTFGYGFNGHECWCDSLGLDGSEIPATDKEVEEALIKEAKKRGFKEGVTIDATNITDMVSKYYTLSNRFGFEITKDYGDTTLRFGGSPIFADGKWAEIVKDEPIKIGGYEVKKHPDEDVYTTIDGNIFTKEFWQAAKKISEHSKAKIIIGCSKQFNVDLETINKILNL